MCVPQSVFSPFKRGFILHVKKALTRMHLQYMRFYFCSIHGLSGALHKLLMPAHTAGTNAGFLLGKLYTSLMCSISSTLKRSSSTNEAPAKPGQPTAVQYSLARRHKLTLPVYQNEK